MTIKFNEARLSELGYHWNHPHTYMFKTYDAYTIFIYPDGATDFEGDWSSAIEQLRKENL